MRIACLCGSVAVELDRRPAYLFRCNCDLCRKSGATWGYFAPSEVRVSGATTSYRRADKPSPNCSLNFCPTCGATTHFETTPEAVARIGRAMVGVNLALADEGELAGIELQFPDGRNWSGEGPFAFIRPARILGD